MQTIWEVVAAEDVKVIVLLIIEVVVAVIAVPRHPLAVGVIVKVVVTGAFVVLINVPMILPVPLAAMPVMFVVLFLVQL